MSRVATMCAALMETSSRSIRWVLLVAGIFWTLSATAAESPVTTLKDLVDNGQFKEAYSLGLAAMDQYEGDIVFDFNFGLAALQSGDYSEAIYALERVLIQRADSAPRVRLEMARAYYLSGDLVGARREFNRVLANNPPPNVRANIQQFIANMDAAERQQSRNVALYLETFSGNDSNINSATSDGTVNTPFGTFDLSQNGQEQDDVFVTYGGGLLYSQVLNKTNALDFQASASKRDNLDSSTFDLTNLKLEGGWGHQLRSGDRLRIGARAQNVLLDDSRFQTAIGLIGSYSHQFENWTGIVTTAATGIRYKGDHDRDTNQYLVAATGSRQLGLALHAFTLYGAAEPARLSHGKHNGRDFYGLSYILQYQLTETLRPYFALSWQDTQYDDNHPVFIVERDDEMWAGRLGVNWLPFPKLSVRGEFRYTDTSSNISVFDYDRSEIELGARWTF